MSYEINYNEEETSKTNSGTNNPFQGLVETVNNVANMANTYAQNQQLQNNNIPDDKVNNNDERINNVEYDKYNAFNESDKTFDKMINESDWYFQNQINASTEWGKTQSQLQQDRTDFTIEQIEQQKKQANKDYVKEQSGAYADWQKESNRYGVNAEQQASAGLQNTGYSESSQVSMYNAYQNRVATARESYNKAVLNYDNAIKEARLQNNSALAEIAYNTLQTSLELSLQGFQYKNQLVLEKANARREIDNNYWSRYQDVFNQINTEKALAETIRSNLANEEQNKNALAETIRSNKADEKYRNNALAQDNTQFNQSLDFNKQQHADDIKYKYDALEQDSAQFNQSLDFNKQQHADDKKYKYDALDQDIKQFNQNLDFNKQQHSDDIKYKYDALEQDQGQFMLNLEEKVRQYDTGLAEEIRQFNENLGLKTSKSGSSGTSGSGSGSKSASGGAAVILQIPTKKDESAGSNGTYVNGYGRLTSDELTAKIKSGEIIKYTDNKGNVKYKSKSQAIKDSIKAGNTTNANNKIKSLESMKGQYGSETAIANSIVAYASSKKISTDEAAYMLNYFGYDVSKYLE